MSARDQWLSEVGAWVSVPATLMRVRVHQSQFGRTTVRHDLVDDDQRLLYCWQTAPLGESGDRGTVTGLVSAHEDEFGRPVTRLADARFRAWDPDEIALEDRLAAAFEEARPGRGASLASPDGAKRTDVRRNDAPPRPQPTPPVDDHAWTKRFARLDFED